MEKGGVFNTRYDKWFDAAANMVQDGSREVCAWNKHVRLQEQTENGWLLSLMWWFCSMQAVSTWLMWDPIQYTGRVAFQSADWQSSFTASRHVGGPHVRLHKQPHRNFPLSVTGWPALRNKSPFGVIKKRLEIPKNITNLTSKTISKMTRLSGIVWPHNGLSSTCFGIQWHGTPGTLRVSVCE